MIREFLKRKGIGFYLSFAAAIFSLLGMILYIVTMSLQENMLIAVIVVSAIGTIAGLITCFGKDYLGLLTIFSAMLYFFAMLLFLMTQAENIGYALADVGIGDGIMPSFVVGLACYGCAVTTGIAAVCLPQEKSTIKNKF